MSDQIPQLEIDRIQAMLNLAHGTNFEAEAANAMAMAARILQRYNLDMAEFENRFGEKPGDDQPVVSQAGVQLDLEMSQVFPQWLAILVNAIAKACFCKGLTARQNTVIIFIGRKKEAETARMMLIEVYQKMTAQLPISMTEYARSRYNPWKSATAGKKKLKRDWSKSWLLGCASGIADALAITVQEVQQTNTGMALMVNRDAENLDYINRELGPRGETKLQKHDTNHEAIRQGYSAGLSMGQRLGQAKLEG